MKPGGKLDSLGTARMYMHIYIYIYIYIMHACMHACMYVCMYVYIYIYIYVAAAQIERSGSEVRPTSSQTPDPGQDAGPDRSRSSRSLRIDSYLLLEPHPYVPKHKSFRGSKIYHSGLWSPAPSQCTLQRQTQACISDWDSSVRPNAPVAN